MLFGWFSVGARFTFVTVIVSDLSFVRLPSLARTEAEAVPESENPGARWMFPVVVFVAATVAYEGPDTGQDASAYQSGSLPVLAWSAVCPSAAATVFGWLIV